MHKIPPSVVWMTKEQDIFWTMQETEEISQICGKDDAPFIQACISGGKKLIQG